MQGDFTVDRNLLVHGTRLTLESPNRSRIFTLKNNHRTVGMVNLLFTISTAMGGMVLQLEDFFIHPAPKQRL